MFLSFCNPITKTFMPANTCLQKSLWHNRVQHIRIFVGSTKPYDQQYQAAYYNMPSWMYQCILSAIDAFNLPLLEPNLAQHFWQISHIWNYCNNCIQNFWFTVVIYIITKKLCISDADIQLIDRTPPNVPQWLKISMNKVTFWLSTYRCFL